jgi:DNA-binding MarR family transcriptional regulator
VLLASIFVTALPDASHGPGHELSHELFRSFRTLHMLKAEVVELLPPGLDPAAAQLLSMLVTQGPTRQNDLAGHTFLDPSTVSRRVSQLVEVGLAERRADPDDGRAVRLAATTEGITLVGRIRAARERTIGSVLAGWSETDVHALATQLRTFNDAVDDYRRQPPETQIRGDQ